MNSYRRTYIPSITGHTARPPPRPVTPTPIRAAPADLFRKRGGRARDYALVGRDFVCFVLILIGLIAFFIVSTASLFTEQEKDSSAAASVAA
jgi:hypothetical protein